MQIRRLIGGIAAIGMIASVATASIAQKPAETQKKPGLMAKMKGMLHKKTPAAQGQIIGNKVSKVYHMPGASGTLPAEKNRVYFKTEAEATAAGYHKAGTPGPKKAAMKGPARDPKTGKFIKKN